MRGQVQPWSNPGQVHQQVSITSSTRANPIDSMRNQSDTQHRMFQLAKDPKGYVHATPVSWVRKETVPA